MEITARQLFEGVDLTRVNIEEVERIGAVLKNLNRFMENEVTITPCNSSRYEILLAEHL